MIKYEKKILDNGLRVIAHRDTSSPIAAMNILYNVGARDEHPDKTGFAHLFEHLMFGGSINIPSYDEPLQKVGGENNAFTNNDITNYYLTLPVNNIETAFWLESDRMLDLAFNQKSLDVQRNVVSEEYRQRYLNQPYGDIWLLLRPLAYKVHPYQWATIGKEISHITNATMDDVRSFYEKYYNPENAILSVASSLPEDKIFKLAEKWFSTIKKGGTPERQLPQEPTQTSERRQTVHRDVPFDTVILAFHSCSRLNNDYYSTDMLSDILSNGKSSRFYNTLVREKKIFSEIDAYITGDIDEGLFLISGKMSENNPVGIGEEAIYEEISKLCTTAPSKHELEKIKNRIESNITFSGISNSNKAFKLGFSELLGDIDLVNNELDKYKKVTAEQISATANKIFKKENCSVLLYLSKKTKKNEN